MNIIEPIAEALETQTLAGNTVGCVGLVADAHGILHQSSHGLRTVGEPQPMTSNSVFRLYSMTKAIGTIAALQLVEQGRLSLDQPVADLLEDFRHLRRLTGWNGDAPVLEPLSRPCTVRHLMTHTSGLVYDFWNEDQLRLSQHLRVDRSTGARANLQAFHHHFEPGEQWAYGVNTDWLGLVVETVTGENIRDYLRREILAPLKMPDTDVIFRDDLAPRKVGAHAPSDTGFQLVNVDGATPDFHGMGGGMKGTGPDYVRLLRAILRGGELDGARILTPETTRLLMQNAIGDLRLERLGAAMPQRTASLDFFPGVDKTFTLGFMRVEQDVEGRRPAGSLSWAGIMNTHYWIDPTNGLIGVLMMQQSPFMSPEAMSVYDAFERAVYRELT